MKSEKFHFRTNARLKDLLGRGLILNDNVAIIELIKNASDANSKEVRIEFSNALAIQELSKICIQDFGDGMSLEDFNDKWLNIAYSGKKNQLNKGRSYAGEKGVGRFSCDRLGKKLHLISKKRNSIPFESIIDWRNFELDDKNAEISSIDITAREISEDEYSNLTNVGAKNHGTLIVVEDLRSTWGQEKLDDLRKELERFIIDPDKKFSVYLRSTDFKDKSSGKYIFDGYVENRLYDKLDDKTITVHSEIVEDGNLISNEIRHNGKTVLRYRTKNSFDKLSNARVQIHYLNPGAKVSFKNITGYTSADYGSIMMFLNGFRVMPYGEPKDDWLGLNQRKAQGTARNLGTREVFGRVEISDTTGTIIPVTSREGVENNEAFLQLSSYDLGSSKRSFIHSAFLALEAYVVNGLDWDRVEPKSGDYSYKETLDALLRSVEIIENRNELFDLKIDEEEIRKIAKAKIADYENFVEKLKEDVADKQVYELSSSEKRQVKKFVDRLDTRLQAATASTEAFKKSATTERKRRLFLEAHSKPDSVKNKELVHHMRLLGDKIGSELKDVLRELKDVLGMVQSESNATTLIAKVTTMIQSALFNNEKLSKLARVVSRADFDMMSDSITEDVLTYVEQYVGGLIESKSTFKLNLEYQNQKHVTLPLSFSPIELSMLVDNIIENATVAESKNLTISASENSEYIDLDFKNDGKKLTSKYVSEDLFLSGITTTTGSGIGLAQVSRIAKALDAHASISNNSEVGITLKIRWAK